MPPLPLGQSPLRGDTFAIQPDDRAQHVAIVGMTGTGKATPMRNMLAHNLHAGSSVTVIDPHESLIEEALARSFPIDAPVRSSTSTRPLTVRAWWASISWRPRERTGSWW